MVDLANVSQVTELYRQRHRIERSLQLFDGGGRISALTIDTGADPPTGEDVTITTEGMSYPPAMITAIRGMLEAKRGEINQQLANLGVTGA